MKLHSNPNLRHLAPRIALASALIATLLIAPANALLRTGPDGNDYEVVLYDGPNLTWQQARAAAGARGNILATIHSEAMDFFIETLRQDALREAGIDPFSPTAPALWVGGSQASGSTRPDAGWNWQLGEGGIPTSASTPGYGNWLPGEPNDWPSSVEDGEENYLSIGFQGRFGWNDSGAAYAGHVERYTVVSPNGVAGPFRNPTNGHYYEFVMTGHAIPWEDAEHQARCRTHGAFTGHLATITSSDEAAFVEARRLEAMAAIGFPASAPDFHPPLWLGGRQSAGASAVGAAWSWVHDDGAVGSGYSDWATGEPDDAPGAGVENGEENYLAIRSGGWRDSSAAAGYVVEYEDLIPTELQLRSTRYDGSNGYRFPYRGAFTRNVAMAVETWVYREDGSRVETILSQGFANSYWLGFVGEKIRFYRSGGGRADSLGNVPGGQWTHVAISYDGAFVRFYINGESAGERALANSGTGTADDLYLGWDPSYVGSPYALRGALDEVRLWSRTRSRAQFRDGMFRELRGVTGLEAVWPRGGRSETVGSTDGTAIGTAPQAQRIGMLPRELVVPVASRDPMFDGNVDPGGEYAGAEQVVLRYQDGPNYKDAVAYLVHTKDYLYVGVEGARLPTGGAPNEDNAISAYLDADGSSTSFDPEMMQGRVFAADGLSGFSRVRRVTIEGPGGFPTSFNTWGSATPPSYQFQSRMGTERRNEITTAPDVEFRFHRSLLGDFDPDIMDRLALSHTDNGGPHGDRWAPHGTDANTPAGWNELRYHPYPGVIQPRVSARVWVQNPATSGGVANVRVSLRRTGVEIANGTTNSSGFFEFVGVPVPEDTPLEIAISPPDGALLDNGEFARDGIAPTGPSPFRTTVRFAGCSIPHCQLATLTFNVTAPIGRTELTSFELLPSFEPLTSFEPSQVWPPVLLRGGADPKTVPTATVRVEGDNLHGRLEFYFARRSCPNDLSLSICTPGVDYFPADDTPAASTFVPATGGDVAHILVEVPHIPESRYGFMRLTAHDTWYRPPTEPGGAPVNNPSSAGSWRNFAENISVGPPPYHLLHAFAFENEEDGHDIDDYRAAFPDQVCDPRYMVGFWAFSPIYLSVLGGGECVGMTVTAQQFAHGRSTAVLHPDVIYGNGFPTAAMDSTLPIMPATFNVSNICSPAPTNVWAAIKANQGAQLSSEFIGATLEQFRVAPVWDMIDISAQLDKIRGRETQWILCMRNGDKGHCVQPLRVIDTVTNDEGVVQEQLRQIQIWDNNFPEQVRTIDIDLTGGDTYTYDGGFEDGPWTGNWLLVYRVDPLFNRGRHVPSLDVAGYALARFGVTHLWEFFQMFVSGEAEPLLTAGDGSRTGWTADGKFVAEGQQTIPIPNFNWIPGDEPALGHYPMSMHHRMGLGAPSVQIHNRGSNYKIHNSHHGTMFQMFVEGAKPDAIDVLSYREDGGRVLGMDFESGREGRRVETRVALSKNASEYPGAVGVSEVEVPEGRAIGIETLPDGSGFHFRNDTGKAIAPNFLITVPSEQGTLDTLDTPNLGIADGATLTVSSPDGSNYTDLVFEIDVNSDGLPESAWQFTSGSGDFVQYIAPAEPWMSIAAADDRHIVLVHPDGIDGWFIEHCSTLEEEDWKALDTQALQVEINDGLVYTYVPRELAAFYRLTNLNL